MLHRELTLSHNNRSRRSGLHVSISCCTYWPTADLIVGLVHLLEVTNSVALPSPDLEICFCNLYKLTLPGEK